MSELSKAQKDRARFAEMANKAGFAQKCEHCGSPDVGHKWNVFAYVLDEDEGEVNVVIPMVKKGSALVGAVIPQILFTCHQCGFTRMFQRNTLEKHLKNLISKKGG